MVAGLHFLKSFSQLAIPSVPWSSQTGSLFQAPTSGRPLGQRRAFGGPSQRRRVGMPKRQRLLGPDGFTRGRDDRKFSMSSHFDAGRSRFD